MTKICSINHHIDGEYVKEVYDVSKCIECGWRLEPKTTEILGLYSITSLNRCLKSPLKTHGLRIIRNIHIMPSWCPLPEKEEGK